MDRRLSPRYFDNAEPLVSTRNQMVDAHECSPGSVIPADLDHRIRLKLWMSGRAKYQRDYSPSPVAEDDVVAQSGPVELKEVGSNGYYELHAPWLDEPIKVRGKGRAEKALEELRAGGEPQSYKGVTISEPNNGGYEIKADWISLPFVRHGEAAAKALAATLRQHGPFPEDAEGVGTVEIDESKFLIVTPWGTEDEVFEGTAEQATVHASVIRAAGEPEPDPDQETGEPNGPENDADQDGEPENEAGEDGESEQDADTPEE